MHALRCRHSAFEPLKLPLTHAELSSYGGTRELAFLSDGLQRGGHLVWTLHRHRVHVKMSRTCPTSTSIFGAIVWLMVAAFGGEKRKTLSQDPQSLVNRGALPEQIAGDVEIDVRS